MSNLGKGLSALFGEITQDTTNLVPIDSIYPNPFQPRRVFDQDALEQLAQSIRENGLLQPIVVRKQDETYQIIAGERRWRAANIVGLTEMPVVLKHCSDEELLGIALIENLQRENLNPMEEAESFQRLIHDYGKSHEEVGKIISKSRSHVANTLRLVTLPESIQNMVRENKITSGHARCLVGVTDAEKLAERIIAENLNVRETEDLARNVKIRHVNRNKDLAHNSDISNLSINLSEILGMKVAIQLRSSGSGSLQIQFQDYTQLDYVVSILQKT